MITASHNPKEDNGYKVYASNGAQIIGPMDKAIASAIAANAAPWAPYGAAVDGGEGEAALLANPLITNPGASLIADYIAALKASLCRHEALNARSAPRPGITYTAMHGVGLPFVEAAFAAFGLPPFTPVLSQVAADPTFPTVAFPNPEEGAGALALSFAAADAAGDTLVLANDPDADRLAVAEWTATGGTGGWTPRAPGAPGSWRVFTGNEVGALLASWQWRCYLEAGGDPQKASMFASTVSSKLLRAMAAKEGFEYVETLTGFKWMGNAMAEAEGRGRTSLFAFEEAIGFCCGAVVRDKDGVGAAAVLAEMAGVLAGEGRTLGGQLAHLASAYGTFYSSNGYVFVDAPAKTEAIFARLRNEGHYWATAGGLRITAVRDLRAPGYDSEQRWGAPVLATSSGTHMLTYKFENGVVATLRASGTEPKLKFYVEGEGEEAGVKAEVERVVKAVYEEMIRPEVHGLKR